MKKKALRNHETPQISTIERSHPSLYDLSNTTLEVYYQHVSLTAHSVWMLTSNPALRWINMKICGLPEDSLKDID